MKRFLLFLLLTMRFCSHVPAFGQTTTFPTSVDTDASLFVMGDNVQSTLSSAMGSGDTVAVIVGCTPTTSCGFVANMIVTVCDVVTSTGKCTTFEHMKVTSVVGNGLTVARGVNGTAAAAHAKGKLITALFVAGNQKVLKDAVVALETAVGIGATGGPQGSGAKVQRSTGATVTNDCVKYDAAGNAVDAGAPCNSSSIYSATTYNFAAQTPGGSLSVGSNSVTLTPCPLGVNGTNTTHYLYLSGGTGSAEGALITGGTCTSGATTGTVFVTAANTHSGAWTVQSASGGIQEAICAMPTAGGQVDASAAITLRANVGACSKVAVSVQKLPGSAITAGSYTVMGNAVYGYTGLQMITNANSADPTNGQVFAVQSQSTCQTSWSPYDTGTLLSRCTTADAGTSSQSALTVQQDFHGASGAPWTIAARLNVDHLTSVLGGAALLGWVVNSGTATGENFGVHGQAESTVAGSIMVAINGEGDIKADVPGTLIGLNANIGSGSVGTQFEAWGLNAAVTYPTGVGKNVGGLGRFAGGGGKQTYGVTIQDGGSTIDTMLELQEFNSNANVLRMWNRTNNTNAGVTDEIQMGRGYSGYSPLTSIVTDTQTAGSFLNGSLDLQTMINGTTMTSILRLDDGGLHVRAKTISILGTPANGTMIYCSDCQIANPCAGGGTGAFAKRLAGAWVCN